MGTHSIRALVARQSGCNEHTHNKGHTRAIGCRQVCKCHTRPRPITKRQSVTHLSALLDQVTGNNAREVILVIKNVVVSWLARTEQACVAVEVIISFYWVHNIGVDDRSRATVPILVTVTIGGREEHYFVGFGNDNKCDLGVETESCTCVYGSAVASRRARSI